MKNIEAKLFKYGIDGFDKKLSKKQICILMSFFNKENQEKCINEIDNFIEENKQKINHIFIDNKNRYIPFLMQPEIYIIFWGLSNCIFSITDNWCFDDDELELIKNLWCII